MQTTTTIVKKGKLTVEDLQEFGISLDSLKEAKDKNNELAGTIHQGESQSSKNISDFEDSQAPVFNLYPGDEKDNSPPLRGDYQTLNFPNPAVLASYFTQSIQEGVVTLHPWQISVAEELATAKCSSQHPYKYALCAANGSGKDAFVIAPFVIWFALSKIRSLTIITSSSGVQLSAQTENYIRTLAQRVNDATGEQYFRIRQRYIKCLLSGSEIRLFATDEAGKAEGYHPLEPNAEMAIIINEWKSVDDNITNALKRCTGYNYWIGVSTPGEPMGAFYRAYTNWKHTRRVTAYDCPHISRDEIEADKLELGEHSALFRSMRLALFTSIGGTVVISKELVDQLLKYPPTIVLGPSWETRVGVDLASGGAENCVVALKGNKLILEKAFRETDTTITADKLNEIFTKELKLSKTHKYIYIDDGNVGHSIIDMLRRMGWININRVRNQSPAIRKKEFGNLGAEMWNITKRVFEERLFDVSQLSETCRLQLCTRHYKQQSTQGRIFLEAKLEAIANGRPSPDRADAFILSLRGLTLDDFLKAEKSDDTKKDRPKTILRTNEEIEEYHDSVVYGKIYEQSEQRKNVHGSLQTTLKHNCRKSVIWKTRR